MRVHASIDPDWPRPAEIVEHWQRMVDLLLSQGTAASVERPLLSGAEMFSPLDVANRIAKVELDHEASLALLSSVEALFQVDRQERRKARRSDDLGRKLSRLRPTRSGGYVGIEPILDIWEKHLGKSSKVQLLKPYLKLRHWLAHGRWWVERRSGKVPVPEMIWGDVQRILKAHPDLARTALRS